MVKSFRFPEYHCAFKKVFIDFIQYKKATGRKERLYATVLKTFDTYCVQKFPSVSSLDRNVVNSFLQVTEHHKFSTVLTYASVLRELGRYMRQMQGIGDAYVAKLRGSRKSTYTPYIFNREQIVLVLEKASDFRACNNKINPNMKNVVSCLYTMLYCTGVRVSEALSLKLNDVSLDKQTILVTESKSGKQRILPISNSLVKGFRDYYKRRCSLYNTYFFDSGSNHNYGRIDAKTAYRYFRVILEEAGIPHRGKGEGPRLHDLRDTFAVHSLQKLVSYGGDVNVTLEYLSLYMGHRSIYETQDYLWMTEELATDLLDKTSVDAAFLSDEYSRMVADNDI